LDFWRKAIAVKKLGNGTASLTLETEAGVTRVRGLTQQQSLGLTEGQIVAVFGAIRQGGTNTVAEGRFTVVIVLKQQDPGSRPPPRLG
jgi:hypothetical protein